MKFLAVTLFIFIQFSTAALPKGSVIYGIVPCLTGHECLESSIKRLDFLQRQGVDAIWVSPIFPSDDDSIISYKVTDYFTINPSIGKEETFRRLVSEARKRKMKVLVDFVPNHTSDFHPFALDAKKRGENSPYYHFYARNDEGGILTNPWWPDLYYLNYDNDDVPQHMLKALSSWIEKFDVDGFRIDAAWELKNRAKNQFPKIIREVNKLKKDLIWIAEARGSDPYYSKSGYSLGYDWNGIGKWSWRNVFVGGKVNIEILDREVKKTLASETGIMRFLNNNDTGERFISRHGLNIFRLAAILQFTLPGAPMVYMGDMSGEEFDPYEDPKPLNFKDNKGLFALYRNLAHLKENFPALSSAHFKTLAVDTKASTYAYIRGKKNPAVVLLNFGGDKKDLSLENPWKETNGDLALMDLIKNKEVKASFEGKKLKVSLKPYEGVVLALKKRTTI